MAKIHNKIKHVTEILKSNLCVGCGGCTYLSHDMIKMEDVESEGKRPVFPAQLPDDINRKIIDTCPGIFMNTGLTHEDGAAFDQDRILFGKTLDIYEGWAADDEIRYNSSSGGIVSALALYCLEKEGMNFVVHTGKDPDVLWKNKTIISKTKNDIVNGSGSRYSPSSPCEYLEKIEQSDKPCVFIGKPCDVAFVSQARKTNKKLDEKLGLVLSFFCAGVPSTAKTLALVDKLQMRREELVELYYRGKGWPGMFTLKNEAGEQKQLTYDESWGFLARKSRQLRCHLCPDGLGEFSDITSGDAWHRKHEEGNEGCSIILVRTEQGKRIIEKAIQSGYIQTIVSNAGNVIKAQGLVEKRKVVLPRILGLMLLRKITPEFEGFFLSRAMKMTPITNVVRNVLGMVKRALLRK